MSQSLFGKLDVDKIPRNPFWIEAGTYDAVVKNVRTTQQRDGNWKFVIRYAVTEAGEYYGNTAEEWIDFDPEMTQEEYEALSGEEKQIAKRAQARIKNRLELFGVPEAEMNGELNFKDFEGLNVIVDITNGGDDKQYVNVRNVRPAE